MNEIGWVVIFVLLAVLLLVHLSVPPRVPPVAGPFAVCPNCRANNALSALACPNCKQTALTRDAATGAINCPRCLVPPSDLKCRTCGVNLIRLIQ